MIAQGSNDSRSSSVVINDNHMSNGRSRYEKDQLRANFNRIRSNVGNGDRIIRRSSSRGVDGFEVPSVGEEKGTTEEIMANGTNIEKRKKHVGWVSKVLDYFNCDKC